MEPERETTPIPPAVDVLPSTAEAALELVQSRGRSRTKLFQNKDGFAFAPIYGLTAVFMLTPSCIEDFAKPLFQSLSRHHDLREVLLLLPPESYHMTLRGLESVTHTTTIAQLHRLENHYRGIFFCAPISDDVVGSRDDDRPDSPRTKFIKELGSAPAVALRLEDPFDSVGVIMLVEPQGLLSEQLVMAQDTTRECLGMRPHVQEYHVSVGYYITEDPERRRWAQQLVLREAKRILGSGKLLMLDPPHVCWYDTMERFTPLFN